MKHSGPANDPDRSGESHRNRPVDQRSAREIPFGVYIHWPYCDSKCPYCDFNSHVASRIDVDEWSKAYVKEIDRTSQLATDRTVRTIYFGGGTPSLMPDHLVGGIIDQIARKWRMANDVEITLEANPGSVEANRFNGYRAAGVNRISIGVQALNDSDLRKLGRKHTAAEAMAALDIARAMFARVNFDLIYARQNQSLSDWEKELRMALDRCSDHISLYQLTIEDGTVFSERFARGMLSGLPGEELCEAMFELTQDICSDHGLVAYEVSNHAREGSESRHNLLYWNSDDYCAIGPGAHGRLTIDGTRWATEAIRSPGAWLAAVSDGKAPETAPLALSQQDNETERVLMGMRLAEGLELPDHSSPSRSAFNHAGIRELIDLGLLEIAGKKTRATRRGRKLLNSVIERMLL